MGAGRPTGILAAVRRGEPAPTQAGSNRALSVASNRSEGAGEDQLGELKKLQEEGKIRHFGLSEVSVEDIESSRKIIDVVSVQNLYNLANRKSEEILNYCEKENIGFIPWFPVAAGDLARPGGPLDSIGKSHHATVAQLALAWLLKRSPVMLPIPGTSSIAHLEENTAAAGVQLSDSEFQQLASAG